MKKLISMILALSLGIALLTVGVFAADAAPLELAAALDEETNTVTVVLRTDSVLSYANVSIKFKCPEGFTLTGITRGADFDEFSTTGVLLLADYHTDGYAGFASMTTSGYTENIEVPAGKEFLIFTLDASAAAPGEYTFDVYFSAAADFEGTSLSWELTTLTSDAVKLQGSPAGAGPGAGTGLSDGKPADNAGSAAGGEQPGEAVPPQDGTSGDPVDVGGAQSFEDVADSAWYKEAVDFVSSRQLFHGVSQTQFAPDLTMTRAMLVTVLYRLEGEPAAAAANTFTDVASGTWYTDAVAWADENKIVEGYGGGLFGPGDYVTREQMAAVLYRYMLYLGMDASARGSLSAFTDSGLVSAWAAEAVRWTVGSGIMTGKSAGVLDPTGSATRAEVATMLMRLTNLIAR